jgi:type IV fimbrial biogenesis protein FimT
MKTASLQRGVTLVEVSIVLAVLGIVMTSAAPGMQGLIDTRRLDGAATQLASDLQFVRSMAVARNQPVRLSFHTTSTATCYVIHTGLSAQCDCSGASAGSATAAVCSGDAEQIKTVVLPAQQRVTVQANATSVLFDPLHGTSTPTGTLRVIGPQGRAVHHVVNVMGRVRSCSPSSTVPGYRAC